MPERITQSMVRRYVERMQQRGLDVGLDWAYGAGKIESKDGGRSLSPRVPNRQLLDWLNAYEEGFTAGQKEEKKNGTKSDKLETLLSLCEEVTDAGPGTQEARQAMKELTAFVAICRK